MPFCKQQWQRTRTCALRYMEGIATWERVSGPFGPFWYLIHSGFSVEDCPMEYMNEWGSRIQKDLSSNASDQDSIFQRVVTVRQQAVLGNPGKGTNLELCLSLVENCHDLEADFQHLLCYVLFHDGMNIHWGRRPECLGLNISVSLGYWGQTGVFSAQSFRLRIPFGWDQFTPLFDGRGHRRICPKESEGRH